MSPLPASGMLHTHRPCGVVVCRPLQVPPGAVFSLVEASKFSSRSFGDASGSFWAHASSEVEGTEGAMVFETDKPSQCWSTEADCSEDYGAKLLHACRSMSSLYFVLQTLRPWTTTLRWSLSRQSEST